jgi:hypothetical protein
MLSKVLLVRKMADSSIMCWYRRTALVLSEMHGHKSLTLSGRSFLGHSSDVVATIVA